MKKNSRATNSHPDALTEDELEVQLMLTEHLDAQVRNLDFNISSKLSAARHRALAGKTESVNGRFGIPRLVWPGFITSTCALVLVAVLAIQINTQQPAADLSQLAANEHSVFIENLTILSASDDIDFYQSVEFLEWMEMNAGSV